MIGLVCRASHLKQNSETLTNLTVSPSNDTNESADLDLRGDVLEYIGTKDERECGSRINRNRHVNSRGLFKIPTRILILREMP